MLKKMETMQHITVFDVGCTAGLGWVRLRLPGGEQLDVFNTHLHANYSHKVAAHKAAPHKPAAHKATPSDSGASPSGGSAAGDAADAFDVPADAFGPYRVAQVGIRLQQDWVSS